MECPNCGAEIDSDCMVCPECEAVIFGWSIDLVDDSEEDEGYYEWQDADYYDLDYE